MQSTSSTMPFKRYTTEILTTDFARVEEELRDALHMTGERIGAYQGLACGCGTNVPDWEDANACGLALTGGGDTLFPVLEHDGFTFGDVAMREFLCPHCVQGVLIIIGGAA